MERNAATYCKYLPFTLAIFCAAAQHLLEDAAQARRNPRLEGMRVSISEHVGAVVLGACCGVGEIFFLWLVTPTHFPCFSLPFDVAFCTQ